MNDPLEQQTVTDFVLESEANIEIAVHVASSFADIKRKVAVPILDALETKLKRSLGVSWEIYNCRDEVLVKRWAGFTVSRKSWGEIYINFEVGEWGDFANVGIWRDRKSPKSAAVDTPLAEAFRKKTLTGDSNRYWAWSRRLPDDKGNWNAAPALAAMRFHSGKVVDYLAQQILTVHKIAAPIIDGVVSGKK